MRLENLEAQNMEALIEFELMCDSMCILEIMEI